MRALGLAVLLGAAAGGALAENIDPAADGSQYAWAENVGWINAEPSGDGGPGVQVDDFELTGWMWAENVGWISLSCKNTGTCDVMPYGVRHDGAGGLWGHAWSENVGWISVSCSNTDTCASAPYGVTIDVSTGDFGGEAWAENAGWIRFASSGPNPFKIKTAWNCDPPPAVPGGSPTLLLEKAGPETILSWSAVAGATGYDVVHGELTALRNDPNRFAAATLGCLDDNATDTAMVFSAAPPVGEGFWFLVRGVNCGGGGTYDSAGSSQLGPRDADIAASGADCS